MPRRCSLRKQRLLCIPSSSAAARRCIRSVERLQYQPRFGRVNRRIEGSSPNRPASSVQFPCFLDNVTMSAGKMTDADRALSIEDKGDCRYSAR